VADRPQHILEIPDSLGRDVDRHRAGDGPAPPMEAFLSDGALEAASQATAAATAPVREQDLVPISKAEAARRTTFGGEHLPDLPRTRRVLPVPFRRDRIAAGRHGRAWVTCAAGQLEPGDIVPGVGRLVSAVRQTGYAEAPGVVTGMCIYIKGAGGIERVLDPAEPVLAFRPAG